MVDPVWSPAQRDDWAFLLDSVSSLDVPADFPSLDEDLDFDEMLRNADQQSTTASNSQQADIGALLGLSPVAAGSPSWLGAQQPQQELPGLVDVSDSGASVPGSATTSGEQHGTALGVDWAAQHAHAAEVTQQQDRRGSNSLASSSSGGTPTAAQQGQRQAVLQPGDVKIEDVAEAVTRSKQTNRVAQKKYRTKQKAKLEESEKKIEELSYALKVMWMQKVALEKRNERVEKALSAQQRALVTGIPPIETYRETVHKNWNMDKNTMRILTEIMDADVPVFKVSIQQPPISFSRKQVEDMSTEEFGALWGRYINAFAECLLAPSSADPSTPAGKRLEEVVQEIWRIQCVVCMSRTDAQAASRVCKVGFEPKHAAVNGSGSEATQAMLSSLNLVGRQLEALLKLRKMYLRNLGFLVKQRNQLTAALQSDGSSDSKVSCGDTPTGIKTAELLQAKLEEEHSLLVQFYLAVWRCVLTPFQAASLHVQAHPRSVDVVGLLNMLAASPDAAALAPVMRRTYTELLADGAALTEPEVPMDALIELIPRWLAGEDFSDAGVAKAPSCAVCK